MIVVWVIGAVIGVIVIAVGTMGLLSRTLASTESTAVYDIEEATEWISDQLPDPITARLSHEDVMAVLLWHLGFLRHRGFATFGGVDREAMDAAFGGDDVIADEAEAVDAVLSVAAESERDIEVVDVVAIVELNNRYLDHIGAFGARTQLGTE